MQPVTLWSTLRWYCNPRFIHYTQWSFITAVILFYSQCTHTQFSNFISFPQNYKKTILCMFFFLVSRSIFHHTTQAIIAAPSKNYWKLHFSMKKTHPSLTTSRNDKHKLTNSLTHHIFTDKISLCTLFINMITCVSFFSGFNLGLINRLEKGWGEGVLNCTPDNKKS